MADVEIARSRSRAHLQGMLRLWKPLGHDDPRGAEIADAITRIVVEERGNPSPLWGRLG